MQSVSLRLMLLAAALPLGLLGQGTSLIAHTSTSGIMVIPPAAITTSAIDTTGANFIAVGVGSFDTTSGGGVCALSDNKSNTWNSGTPIEGFFGKGRIFYTGSTPATVGSGHTFTLTCSATDFPAMAVAAFSNVFTGGNPFDQENGAFAGSGPTTLQPGSVTPGSNGELVITSLCFFVAASTISINSSYVITDTEQSNATNFGVSLAYIVQSTAAATNPTWTYSITNNTEATIATFNAGGPPSASAAKRKGTILE